MNVHLSKKAELFHKAVEDIWVAEKIMKGYLRCFNKEYGYDHNLKALLEATEELIDLTKEVTDNILYLNRFEGKLRYKNMSAMA